MPKYRYRHIVEPWMTHALYTYIDEFLFTVNKVDIIKTKSKDRITVLHKKNLRNKFIFKIIS